jgi:hypothetical protein
MNHTLFFYWINIIHSKRDFFDFRQFSLLEMRMQKK